MAHAILSAACTTPGRGQTGLHRCRAKRRSSRHGPAAGLAVHGARNLLPQAGDTAWWADDASFPIPAPEEPAGVLRGCAPPQLQIRRGGVVPDTLGRQPPDARAGDDAVRTALR